MDLSSASSAPVGEQSEIVTVRRWDSTMPVWVGASLLLVFLMALPLGALFKSSLWSEGGFTFRNYVEVFSTPAFFAAIWNTLIISSSVGLSAVVVGGLL